MCIGVVFKINNKKKRQKNKKIDLDSLCKCPVIVCLLGLQSVYVDNTKFHLQSVCTSFVDLFLS